MKNNWLVVVNEKCTINGGDRLAFKTRSEALNAAAFVARILYKVGVFESHVFVVNRIESDIELECKVVYHYDILCKKTCKAMYLFDRWYDNQKLIEWQS